MLSTNETFKVKDQIQILFKVIEMEGKYINISLIRQAFSWRCHLQIKTAPFLTDFHFKSALLILSYP